MTSRINSEANLESTWFSRHKTILKDKKQLIAPSMWWATIRSMMLNTKETSLMGHLGGFLFSDGQDGWDESQERRQDEKRLDFHLRAILGKKASQLPTRAKAVHEVESGAKNTKLLHYLVWGAVFELSISDQHRRQSVTLLVVDHSNHFYLLFCLRLKKKENFNNHKTMQVFGKMLFHLKIVKLMDYRSKAIICNLQQDTLYQTWKKSTK